MRKLYEYALEERRGRWTTSSFGELELEPKQNGELIQ